MIAAVTGATGFIGRYLVERLLAESIDVKILTRCSGTTQDDISGGCQVFRGDLCDKAYKLDGFLEDVDVVYHCAGESNDKKRMHDLHIDGTRKLMEAASGKIKHLVHLSSVGVYGKASTVIAKETIPFAPIGIYEKTKAVSDCMVSSLAVANDFTYTILRPATVFGVDMPNNALRTLVRLIKKGRFFFVGPPGAIFPYVAVEDLAEIMWLCGTHAVAYNQTYNVSTNFTVEKFVEIIAQSLGRSTPRFRLSKNLARVCACLGEMVPGFPLTNRVVDVLTSRTVYDSQKIKTDFGFDFDQKTENRLACFSSVNHLVL